MSLNSLEALANQHPDYRQALRKLGTAMIRTPMRG